MATQALFSFLQRRLRLSVIPTGVGITSANIAADEAYRAAARAVVMARLESVEFVARAVGARAARGGGRARRSAGHAPRGRVGAE